MRNTAFYATAAQVIPVFVIVLGFELRAFGEAKEEEASRGLWLMSLLIALAGGEFLALSALADDDPPSDFTFLIVICGLVWGGMGVFAPLFAPRVKALTRTFSDAILGWGALFLLVYLVAVVLLAEVFRDVQVIPAAVALLWLLALVGSWSINWLMRRFPRMRRPDAQHVPGGVPNSDDSDTTQRN